MKHEYTLEQLGNWTAWKYGPTLNWMFQTRTHDADNEITAIGTGGYGPNWADPTYDDAGNMTTHRMWDLTTSETVKYDAWNRLITYTGSSSNQIQGNEYDGLGRRIVQHFGNRSASFGVRTQCNPCASTLDWTRRK